MGGPSKEDIIPDEEILRLYEELGSKQAVAKALGINRSAVQYRLKALGVGAPVETLDGLIQNRKAVVEDLPPKGEVYRYLVTCAQNNTAVNEGFWNNLMAMADEYEATVLVSQITYNKAAYGAGSVKPGSKQASDTEDLWYDPLLIEYIDNERRQLAPGLVFVGDMNILPSADDPLSGLSSFTGRASGIFPHMALAMESVASVADEPTKFNYTTGCVTRRNYIQKKAGQRAEFHHAYAALIVEVESDGSWWVRQINADGKNRIYDLNLCADGGKITRKNSIEVLTPGDIHASELDEENARALWGEGGAVNTLGPKYQVLHDVLSFRSRTHHEMKSFHAMVKKHIDNQENVEEEIRLTANILNAIVSRSSVKTIIVESNHDRHLYQWLDREDYRKDLPNARFFLEAQLEVVKAMERGDDKFNLFEWAMKRCGLSSASNVTFLPEDGSFITCRRNGGGIENGLHGDRAPNGSRGTLNAFRKMARKLIIGHSHSAGIRHGVYQVGTSSKLRLSYNKGPSSWSHTHCITYKNGKRALFTVWEGKPWATR